VSETKSSLRMAPGAHRGIIVDLDIPPVLYLPAATLLFEWFIARRGMATGIMFSGQDPVFRQPDSSGEKAHLDRFCTGHGQVPESEGSYSRLL
jgi:hypothetical protein